MSATNADCDSAGGRPDPWFGKLDCSDIVLRWYARNMFRDREDGMTKDHS